MGTDPHVQVCLGHGPAGVLNANKARNHLTIVSGRVAANERHSCDVFDVVIVKRQAQGRGGRQRAHTGRPRVVVKLRVVVNL